MCDELAFAGPTPDLPAILGCMDMPSLDSQPAAAVPAGPPRAEQGDESRLRGWIARIARGDEEALGRLYDDTLGRVHGLALRITRDRQAAEEVVEDVYWQVWRQALRFDASRGGAMAWLLTITRSRALDSLRRADEAEAHPEPETLIAAEASADGDPQDLLAATQRDSRLHAALASLDALPRQLLALAYFRGLTHEEIAAHAGLPLGTVKSHIRRALAALKQRLAPEFAATELSS
jgi:RNA polymerase sigma-70 factor (ECF subfamily)